jgi:mono/diheme cytochrome c family protein
LIEGLIPMPRSPFRPFHIAALGMAAFLLAGCEVRQSTPDFPLNGGNPLAGREIIQRIECGVCHTIPGVTGARGTVGPTLDGFGARAYIAGQVPNAPAVLVRWVRNAPDLVPATAMPPMPLTEREAWHVVAYLLTLR